MGHNVSCCEYSNSPVIQKYIDDNQWHSVITDETDCFRLKRIDFGCETLENPLNNKYIIQVDSDIPSNCNITCIFPTHPVQKKRLLWTKSYLGHLNTMSTEINQRIRECHKAVDPNIPLMVVSSGDAFYQFYHFQGPMYLFWAKSITIEQTGRPDNINKKNVPFLVETNGQYQYRNVFLFFEETPLYIHDIIEYNEPWEASLMCCESDPRDNDCSKTTSIRTISSRDVIQHSTDPINHTFKELRDEECPFNDERLLIRESPPFTFDDVNESEE